ncbi:hypothetical protein M378DRAFT_364508 [Amanita muscaria Koide BX008]|uniref:Uncharacterized protein n=1 Tax=Amanita muscaria (strain Koide BX008) TaxID=946122 RepID=A0A0C2WM01_AMAMK|nr:hypothetical protein M378DRAFT_364508 [Amanita muscaria Koide BX008]
MNQRQDPVSLQLTRSLWSNVENNESLTRPGSTTAPTPVTAGAPRTPIVDFDHLLPNLLVTMTAKRLASLCYLSLPLVA